MVLKLKESYGIWQVYLASFPKANRFTIGSKIDCIFIEAIEYAFLASYTHTEEKLNLLEKSISKIDLIKLLLQLSWEIKALDNKKYIILSERFNEIGKMLGGWKKQLENKTPSQKLI
ncbi:MAG: four helix bundle protein [bacterium]